jgi:hypothetical protein
LDLEKINLPKPVYYKNNIFSFQSHNKSEKILFYAFDKIPDHSIEFISVYQNIYNFKLIIKKFNSHLENFNFLFYLPKSKLNNYNMIDLNDLIPINIVNSIFVFNLIYDTSFYV